MRPFFEHFYEFGEFRLDANEKVLWRGAKIADVTPKALEILLVLVENAGHIVSKEEIFRRVWADSFVEDANLTHHIFRLRKVLGESETQEFIETVPKRGYRFIAEVQEREDQVQNDKFAFKNRRKNARPTLSFQKLLIISISVTSVFLLITFFVWQKYLKTEKTEISSTDALPAAPLSISRITNVGKVGGATISPDGKFVAYMQNHFNGEGTLYVRQVETNTEVKLLPPENRIFGSVLFSPDGAFIYYITFSEQDAKGSLYRIPVLGGQPTRLFGDVGYMFTLSPDGTRVAFVRNQPEQKQNSLIIAALDGSDEQKLLTKRYDEMILGVCPTWSPDGKLIAFSGAENPSQNKDNPPEMNVFTVETQNGAIKKLSREGMIDTGKMSWMPDGSGVVFIGDRPRISGQIYFLSYPDGELQRITKELNRYGNYGLGITADGKTLVADLWESTAQLWAIDANGETKNAEQLTTGVGDGSLGLTTLSDGSIVYAARTGNDFDLWMMSEKNGKREGKPLTSDSFYESEVCATPDNRFLVFASERGGNQHLYRINSDGSDIKQLTFGNSFDRAPGCSPDGSSIIYASLRGEKTHLWKIPIEGGEPIQLTDFEADVPNFSSDGKMIACILPSENIIKPATLAVISADGGEPLKTFPVVPFSWNYRPPRWSPDGNSLVFYKTGNMVGNLWKQNLKGGEPKQLTDFKSELIFNHVFSRDGKRLIIARGKAAADVVMLKNFK